MKSTNRDRKLLLDSTADPDDRVRALSRVGADHLVEYEPLVATLLDHEDSILRGKAASVLLGLWQRTKYDERIVEMLLTDPDWGARHSAASAISTYLRFPNEPDDLTNERRTKLLKALVRSITEDEEQLTQANSYRCFIKCVAPDREEPFRTEFDRERDVDWELVTPYLEGD
ncbi:MAG: HEAT repeat domain-containing protein [Polyangiaceae bacterium]|nr:HEAT repeat domain-containing protein [Polyangiaceae bacterium]